MKILKCNDTQPSSLRRKPIFLVCNKCPKYRLLSGSADRICASGNSFDIPLVLVEKNGADFLQVDDCTSVNPAKAVRVDFPLDILKGFTDQIFPLVTA